MSDKYKLTLHLNSVNLPKVTIIVPKNDVTKEELIEQFDNLYEHGKGFIKMDPQTIVTPYVNRVHINSVIAWSLKDA